MIKYLGSKRTLLPQITSIVNALPSVTRICDLFTGTTRVAQALKRNGYFVAANDTATYSYQMAVAYVEADADHLDVERIRAWLDELNRLPGKRGYYTKTFCEDSRYFQPFNGERVDAIRDRIDDLPTNRQERAILLTALMLAADRVDSTTGVQMAYLKKWAARSFKPLELRLPDLLAGTGEAIREDALAFVDRGGTKAFDLTYIDPPYNQHSYFGNYHIWESLMRHDRPDVYGIAKKRVDTNENRSVFNSSRNFHEAFARLISGVQSRFILVSFNNEGYASQKELIDLLQSKGYAEHVTVDFKRYVGAQIGIYNPSGKKVGKVSHLRNKEHLFLVGDKPAVQQALSEWRYSEVEQLGLALA